MIRILEDKDYKSVENLLKKEFHISFPQENPFHRWFVAEFENEIVGFICYSLMYEQIELNYIYVEERYRNQKIATKLMNKMMEEAVNGKVLSITLEVNEHNVVAQKLYQKFGFKIGAIRKNYYGKENGLLMIRKLM